jgi:hypothetical protein
MMNVSGTWAFLLGAAAVGLPRSSAAQCRAANAETKSVIQYLTQLVTAPSSDVEHYGKRQQYGLPLGNASSIVVVTKATTCNSALQKYQATIPTSPAPTSVYVVSVGNTYVVWGPPSPNGTEFQAFIVMSSKFAVLSMFAA